MQQRAIFLKQKLAEIADSFPELIEGVRGDGLMQGLKCRTSNLEIVGACRKNHLLTVPANPWNAGTMHRAVRPRSKRSASHYSIG